MPHQVFSEVVFEFLNFFVVVAISVLGFAFTFLLVFGSQYPHLNHYQKVRYAWHRMRQKCTQYLLGHRW